MELFIALSQFVYTRVQSVGEEDLEDTVNMFNSIYSHHEQQVIGQNKANNSTGM
jgi:hypothetical protein